MRRKLNVKLLGIVLGALLVIGVGVHFLHAYQLRQNAYRLLERGDLAVAEKNHDKALVYYGQYLSFVPNDPDTVQKYALSLDAKATSDADRVRLVLMMEQVLRAKPGEHELRFRLVHNLIALDRVSEAIENLRKLQNHWADKAQVLHMLGWCQEAKKEYVNAVRSFEEAIKLKPTQIETYALLVEVLHDRLHQPEEARKAMDEMIAANEKSHQAYLLRARFHRRSGDEKSADRDLQAALALAPDHPEVVLAVADGARAKGNWEEATRLLQDALKKHPNHVELIKSIVHVKLQTDQHADALVVLRTSVTNLPKSNELAILLIDLMIDQKQYAEARKRITDLEKAGLKPTLPNYLKGRLNVAEEEWSEAIKLLESVRADLPPGSEWLGRVNALLGLSYRQIGDHEQELLAFRRAVDEEPTWLAANLGLSAALLSAGRLEQASQALESVRPTKGAPPEYWILLARCRLAAQLRLPQGERRFGDVEAALANATKLTPKSIPVAVMRAELLTAQRDFTGAETVLKTAQAEHPHEIALWCALAELALQQNQFADAERILEQAAATKEIGDHVELRLAKCRLLSQRGNESDRAKLESLRTNLPKTYGVEQRVRLDRELAETWSRLGDWNRAEKLLREVARALPRDLRSRARLLDLALDKHQAAAARIWLEEIRAIEGESGMIGRCGAIAIQIHEAQGRRASLDDARKQVKDFEKQHKNWPRAALLSATLYELEGKYQQAIQEYTRAVDLGEVQPGMMVRLLTLLVERREFGKAETELGKYEQKLPLTKELSRLGAEIALGMRDRHFAKLAVARAERAVSLPARDYRDALWLAHVYQTVGDTAKAETLLRETLDQAGHAPDTWIAWMTFLTATKRRALASSDLERMKKELPESRYQLTLARCYEALHEPDKAAKAYQDALRARPNDFSVLSHAANFEFRADRSADAQKLYRRLLDPERRAPAEFAVTARRHLATMLATQNDMTARKQAIELLDENRKARGPTIADERIRLYVQSLASPQSRNDALTKYQDSLRIELPTPDERVLLARMLETGDQLNQARVHLAAAVDESPTPYFLVRCTHLLIRLDDLDDAARQCALLDELEPASDRVRELRDLLARARKPAMP